MWNLQLFKNETFIEQKDFVELFLHNFWLQWKDSENEWYKDVYMMFA